MDYLSPYIPILVLLLITGVLCLVIGVGATVLGPRRITKVKESPFECGSPTTGSEHQRHSVKFYLVALLFIVFDIESVFIYPWGALLRDFQGEGLGWFAYFEMLSFMVTLAIGLIYVWRKGALEFST
jgi:NADH-quinone oxidoreductase subunit A